MTTNKELLQQAIEQCDGCMDVTQVEPEDAAAWQVVRAALASQAESAPVPSKFGKHPGWEYCPECGCLETDPPQEGAGYFCANCGQEWHGDMDYSGVVRANLERFAQRAASVEAHPVAAWITEDGERVVTAITMEGAKRDGGATLSSMKPYCVPLYPAAGVPHIERDAARYRYLRDNEHIDDAVWEALDESHANPQLLDQAIDNVAAHLPGGSKAIMAGQGETGGNHG